MTCSHTQSLFVVLKLHTTHAFYCMLCDSCTNFRWRANNEACMHTCVCVAILFYCNSAGESEAAVSSMAEDIVNVVAFYCERRQVLY
jgi:hypothetical protein